MALHSFFNVAIEGELLRRIALILSLFAGLSGCAANDLLVQRQSSLEGRLEQIVLSQNSVKADLAALTGQLQEIKQQSTRQPAAETELLARFAELQEKVKIIANRLIQLESVSGQSATIELVNQESTPAGHEESVQAAYIKAFGLFSANNYSGAAEAFSAFIAAYPESEYTANARYWLGDCYFSLGRYSEAIDSFSRVLEMNPLPKRAADALLKTGSAWYHLDDPEKGSAVLRLLIEKYPGSEAAELAGKQLDKK
ncbi:MAG: tol-pal system protein YbgF [Deltaproteobacteria bacterium HGW-Deltaproteobacteria-23]|nr:MAG: tol-pal system protein YbgF [Deltaproteobacteria bacterium HGW-Deltaproteobacteria-23]